MYEYAAARETKGRPALKNSKAQKPDAPKTVTPHSPAPTIHYHYGNPAQLSASSGAGVIQRRIVAMPPSANWKVISEGARPGFQAATKRVFDVAKDENLCHIIPYNTINNFLKGTIEKHMNDATADGNIASNLGRLVKMVIPSANHRFDADSGVDAEISDQQERALEYRDQLAMQIPLVRATLANSWKIDTPASSLESVLNSSISNLRAADASANQSIGNRIDPIPGSYTVSSKKLNFDGVDPLASQDKKSMAKRMHKLIKLGDELDYTAFVPRANSSKTKIQTSETGRSSLGYTSELGGVNVRHRKGDGTVVDHNKRVGMFGNMR